jgi:hypothetical protein
MGIFSVSKKKLIMKFEIEISLSRVISRVVKRDSK